MVECSAIGHICITIDWNDAAVAVTAITAAAVTDRTTGLPEGVHSFIYNSPKKLENKSNWMIDAEKLMDHSMIGPVPFGGLPTIQPHMQNHRFGGIFAHALTPSNQKQ